MTGFFMFLHAIICIFLVAIILMQSGRSGGLTDSMAGAENVFGAKTNEFMIKATTVFSTLFLITCLGIAVMSAKKDKSLMSDKVVSKAEEVLKKEEIVDVVTEAAKKPISTPTTENKK